MGSEEKGADVLPPLSAKDTYMTSTEELLRNNPGVFTTREARDAERSKKTRSGSTNSSLREKVSKMTPEQKKAEIGRLLASLGRGVKQQGVQQKPQPMPKKRQATLKKPQPKPKYSALQESLRELDQLVMGGGMGSSQSEKKKER